MIKMKKYFITCLLLIYPMLILSVDFKKNIDIIKTPKSDESKVVYISKYQEIREIIFVQKQNAVVVFYADWCPHCKEFLPVFDQASRYDVVSSFKFLQVNCSTKEICDHFKVNKYPTIKVYMDGETNDEEPNRDLEAILEYLNKVTSEPILYLQNKDSLSNFRENYGDINFLVVLDKDNLANNQMFKCIEDLAKKSYKSMFYFGILDKKLYDYKQFQFKKENYPDIISIEDSADDYFFEWYESKSCNDIDNYLKSNRYPYLMRINSHYIKRLQNENKTLFLFAINSADFLDKKNEGGNRANKIENIEIFKNEIKSFSKKNREYIFSYFDYEGDSYLTNFFKLNKEKLPCLILYDFLNRRYFIDYSDFKSFDQLNESLMYIKNSLLENKINWAHGNWIQEFLAKLGINVTERGSLIILGCLFIFILIILIVIIFCFGDNIDEEFEAKKKEFIEKLNVCQELSEEEKKMILESKNFDSFVKMGLEKIIENLKGNNNEEEDNTEEEGGKDEANSIINENSINNLDNNDDIILESPERMRRKKND